MGDAKTKRMSAESNRARRPSDNKLAGKLDYMILVNYSFGILVPNRRRYIGNHKAATGTFRSSKSLEKKDASRREPLMMAFNDSSRAHGLRLPRCAAILPLVIGNLFYI